MLFEKYYIEKSILKKAERINFRNSEEESYIKIRIYRGKGVIIGFYIRDVRVENFNQKN